MLVLNRPGKYWEGDQVTCGMFIVDITGDLSLFTEDYWPSGGSRENTQQWYLPYSICIYYYSFSLIYGSVFESLKVFLQTGIPRVSFGNFIEDREQRSAVEANKYEDMLRYTNISEIWFNIYSAFIFLIISQHHHTALIDEFNDKM